MSESSMVLLDAGIFIGALMKQDFRHEEAFTIIEDARQGKISACTTVSILSEVYAALTWVNAQPPLSPPVAAEAVSRLIESPSAIEILSDSAEAATVMLKLAKDHQLTARRIHDARHAATALAVGITEVYTYDIDDWTVFSSDDISVIGPSSVLKSSS